MQYHPDSVSNLIRRAQNAISGSKSKKEDLERIDELLKKQKTGSDPNGTVTLLEMLSTK